MKRKKKILQREEASQDSKGAEPESTGGKMDTEGTGEQKKGRVLGRPAGCASGQVKGEF